MYTVPALISKRINRDTSNRMKQDAYVQADLVSASTDQDAHVQADLVFASTDRGPLAQSPKQLPNMAAGSKQDVTFHHPMDTAWNFHPSGHDERDHDEDTNERDVHYDLGQLVVTPDIEDMKMIECASLSEDDRSSWVAAFHRVAAGRSEESGDWDCNAGVVSM
jgi:hypothetical protein